MKQVNSWRRVNNSFDTSHSVPDAWNSSLNFTCRFVNLNADSFPYPEKALTLSYPVKACNPGRPLQSSEPWRSVNNMCDVDIPCSGLCSTLYIHCRGLKLLNARQSTNTSVSSDGIATVAQIFLPA